MYNSKKVIDESMLYTHIDTLKSANSSVKAITEFVSHHAGTPIPVQHMRNFLNARYGGAPTEKRVNDLLELYMDDTKNEVLVVRNEEDGVMEALVLISDVQKSIYKLWGDVLVMDWTHHTNNIGYQLGKSVIHYVCIVPY